jgi:hypothetical protein
LTPTIKKIGIKKRFGFYTQGEATGIGNKVTV